MSIAKLLAAQKIDKERILLKMSVEKGDAKTKLDKALLAKANAKKYLEQLDYEAKALQEDYQKLEKILNDTLAQINKANKNDATEIAVYDNFFTVLSKLESQLADAQRRAESKKQAFESTCETVKENVKLEMKCAQVYETQKKNLTAKLQELDKTFNAAIKEVDEKLLAKYQTIREAKSGAKDVVVPLSAEGCCGGCYKEVPAVIKSKIAANEWAICGECGSIIYKNANAK